MIAREQVATKPITVQQIMRSAAFQRGVADVRAGRRPRFDSNTRDGADIGRVTNDAWDYERGRQWATVAPRSMPVIRGRKVNLKAINVYLWSRIP